MGGAVMRSDRPFEKLVLLVATQTGATQRRSRQAIKAVFSTIANSTRGSSRRLVIPKFGVFSWIQTKPRRVKYPNGQWQDLPPMARLKFRASKYTREAIK